jgi:hypothetical protein
MTKKAPPQSDEFAPKGKVERVPVSKLKPHPRNYKIHPQEQIDHIVKSIAEHGIYRNVVVAKDYTILAGHGVVQAIQSMGLLGPDLVPVFRTDLDPEDPRALKILTGDNEISRLAEVDDRTLTGVLKDLVEDLAGTGFDAQSLSALVFVSRPIEEVRDKNEAAEWVGMPAYDEGSQQLLLSMMFRDPDARAQFVKQFEIKISKRSTNGKVWSAWWPFVPRMARQQQVLFTDEDLDVKPDAKPEPAAV